MRPRVGTRPVTLEPTLIQEILGLSRQHDDMLKETRQDLFRAETKLRVERQWKWPIRAACVALGAVGLAAFQNEVLMASTAEFFGTVGRGIENMGTSALFGFVAFAVAIYGAAYLVRRMLRRPSPNKMARKLMEQFAERDGVAAYVFADESPEEEAASIGALTREENKMFRQRRLTPMTRTLSSSMTQLLNRTVDDVQQSVLH